MLIKNTQINQNVTQYLFIEPLYGRKVFMHKKTSYIHKTRTLSSASTA